MIAYLELDGSPELVYRTTSEFPGLGFMLKRIIYDKYINKKFDDCCQKRYV